MNRPCVCGTPGSPGRCHFCQKYDTDERYRRLWSGRRQRWKLPGRVVSFLRSLYRHARAGFPQANPLIRRKRMAICTACPQFNPERQSCGKCGCNLKLKVSWQLEKCPLSYW